MNKHSDNRIQRFNTDNTKIQHWTRSESVPFTFYSYNLITTGLNQQNNVRCTSSIKYFAMTA